MKKSLTTLAALAAIATAGCGDDGGSGGEASKSLSITASEPGPQDTALELPAEVKAGVVSIELKNDGKRDHDIQIIRVEGEHSLDETTGVLAGTVDGKPIPDWFRAAGGIGTTKAGQTRTARQVLAPGKYFAFDTDSTSENGPDNFERGGRAEFEVTGEAGGALPASAGPQIRAKEYSFDTFDLRSGRQDVVFQNIGRQPHHIVAAPIAEGKTIDDVKRFIQQEGGGSGQPPIDEEAGVNTAVIDGGVTQIEQLDLKPGKYALLCFVSDRKGGPPHIAKGMVTEATVR